MLEVLFHAVCVLGDMLARERGDGDAADRCVVWDRRPEIGLRYLLVDHKVGEDEVLSGPEQCGDYAVEAAPGEHARDDRDPEPARFEHLCQRAEMWIAVDAVDHVSIVDPCEQ